MLYYVLVPIFIFACSHELPKGKQSKTKATDENSLSFIGFDSGIPQSHVLVVEMEDVEESLRFSLTSKKSTQENRSSDSHREDALAQQAKDNMVANRGPYKRTERMAYIKTLRTPEAIEKKQVSEKKNVRFSDALDEAQPSNLFWGLPLLPTKSSVQKFFKGAEPGKYIVLIKLDKQALHKSKIFQDSYIVEGMRKAKKRIQSVLPSGRSIDMKDAVMARTIPIYGIPSSSLKSEFTRLIFKEDGSNHVIAAYPFEVTIQ